LWIIKAVLQIDNLSVRAYLGYSCTTRLSCYTNLHQY